LFAGGIALFAGSTALAVADVWPWPISVALNAIAAYALFTVAHDAAHRSVSSIEAVNTWLGRIATAGFAPHASFSVWRFIHMQHHLFTNEDDGRDPDHYTERGPRWQLPLRFLTVDLYYLVFYLPKLGGRPRAEKVELAVTWTLLAGGLALAIATGHIVEVLLLYFLPIRLAILWLGFAFDYLPHNGLAATAATDKFRATRNRVGLERLVTPLLLYQNYHLVHHLHPLIPFHRYIAVWRRGERQYLDQDPALSDLRGRPITPDEYRRMRELGGSGA
jgi:ring-1,2-phenylacetyl-CoA epoxidase subunit PaaE